MTYNVAKQLQNNDEIIVKETGEITKVIDVEIQEKDVFVYTISQFGYTRFHHRDIK